MDRMAVISRDDYDLPLLNLSGWRPGPPTPYSLVPTTRRLEWLALVATPIGGIMAVVDHHSAGGVGVACVLVALVIGVPWLLREGFYRLPLTAARALFSVIAGAVVMAVLAVVVLLTHAPVVLATCAGMFALYGLVFWLLRDRTPA